MQPRTPTSDDVIAALENFRARLGMHIYPVDVANTRSFLHGLELGLSVFGIPFDKDVWWQVQQGRGWMQSALGPVPQMEEKGMAAGDIINELIDIEIETLRRCSAAV